MAGQAGGVAATAPEPRDRSRSPPPRSVVSSAPSEGAASNASSGPVLHTYKEIDTASWTTVAGQKNKQGGLTVFINDQRTLASPMFRMYARGEVGTIVFPVAPRKDAEPPAFLTGAVPKRKVETLELCVTLEGAQLEFAQRVDKWCLEEGVKNSRKWFGRQLTADAIGPLYSSPVKVDEEGRYSAHLRTKIAVGAAEGLERHLTNITVVMDGGAAQEGSGWAFIEPLLGEQQWRQHRARIVVQPRRMWVAAGKYGLEYAVTDLCVLARVVAPRSRPFARDDTVRLLGDLGAP